MQSKQLSEQKKKTTVKRKWKKSQNPTVQHFSSLNTCVNSTGVEIQIFRKQVISPIATELKLFL